MNFEQTLSIAQKNTLHTAGATDIMGILRDTIASFEMAPFGKMEISVISMGYYEQEHYLYLILKATEYAGHKIMSIRILQDGKALLITNEAIPMASMSGETKIDLPAFTLRKTA